MTYSWRISAMETKLKTAVGILHVELDSLP